MGKAVSLASRLDSGEIDKHKIMVQVEQIYHDADFPHGLRCAKCERIIVEGEAINHEYERFLDEGTVLLTLTCMGCAPHSATT